MNYKEYLVSIWLPIDWLDNDSIKSLYFQNKKSLIPQELTPRQIRLALIQSGINLSNIDAVIDQLPEPNKSITKTLREYSLSYSRDDEILIQFASQLGMDSEQLDWLFILWATI